MPRLTTITIAPTPGCLDSAGLKGRLSTLRLAPVTIVAGPNGSGKTTVGPLALSLALVGLAERPNDDTRPYLLDPPTGTTVGVDLDDGSGWSRDLAMSPRTGEAQASTAQALALLGAMPPALDLEAIMRQGPKERRAAMVGLARIGGLVQDLDDIGARALVLDIHAGMIPDEVQPSAWSDTAAAALGTVLDRRQPGADWLLVAEGTASKAQTAANAAKVAADKAIPALDAALKRARAAVPTTTAPDPTPQIADLQTERDELVTARALAAQSATARAEHDARGVRLQTERAEIIARGTAARQRATTAGLLDATGQPIAYRPADLSGYEAAVATARDEYNASIPPPPTVDLTPYEAAVQQAQADVDTATAAADAARAARIEAEQQAETTAAAAYAAAMVAASADMTPADLYREHMHRIDVARMRRDDLASGTSAGPCRKCGEPDPTGHADRLADAQAALDALLSVAPAVGEAAAEAERRRDALVDARITTDRAAHDAATAARHAITAGTAAAVALSGATSRLVSAIAALDAASVRATQAGPDREKRIKTERQARLDRADADLTRALALDDRGAAQHAAALAEYIEARDRTRAEATAAGAALAAWQAEPIPGADVPDPAPRIAEIDREISALQAAAATATAALTTARAAVTTAERNLAAGLSMAEAATVAAQSTRALVRAVALAWVEMARPSVQPIHDTARAIVADAAGLPMPWFAGLDESGAILCGVERDGLRVHYSAASGSERMICNALLLLSMAVVQGARVPVLVLDELDRLHEPEHRHALVAAIARAAADGRIANAIITEAGDPDALRLLYAGLPGVAVTSPAECAPVAAPVQAQPAVMPGDLPF